MKKPVAYILVTLTALALVAVYFLYRRYDLPGWRSGRVLAWLKDPSQHPDWAVAAGTRCPGAVFDLPTRGYIGYLWDDTFRIGQRHQGIDIFGGGQPGETPVLAAADGYLTRLPAWKSSVIIRLPDDPLQPGRQIWTYYTHMADASGRSLIDAAFPPGASEAPVKAGAQLGFQGNYSGDPSNPVGVHLHFSIVRDDGQGHFLNEEKIGNTIDPSPYFNLPLNARTTPQQIPVCIKTGE
jgi:murein DD-endopeptidase MepM/ murein hydrolase activator NlpD